MEINRPKEEQIAALEHELKQLVAQRDSIPSYNQDSRRLVEEEISRIEENLGKLNFSPAKETTSPEAPGKKELNTNDLGKLVAEYQDLKKTQEGLSSWQSDRQRIQVELDKIASELRENNVDPENRLVMELISENVQLKKRAAELEANEPKNDLPPVGGPAESEKAAAEKKQKTEKKYGEWQKTVLDLEAKASKLILDLKGKNTLAESKIDEVIKLIANINDANPITSFEDHLVGNEAVDFWKTWKLSELLTKLEEFIPKKPVNSTVDKPAGSDQATIAGAPAEADKLPNTTSATEKTTSEAEKVETRKKLSSPFKRLRNFLMGKLKEIVQAAESYPDEVSKKANPAILNNPAETVVSGDRTTQQLNTEKPENNNNEDNQPPEKKDPQQHQEPVSKNAEFIIEDFEDLV